MPTAVQHANKRNTLNIRVKVEDQLLIDRAAKARGKTRTDFILDAVKREAEDTLLDQALISVSEEAYQAFLALLDKPPKPSAALKKTMQTSAPWK